MTAKDIISDTLQALREHRKNLFQNLALPILAYIALCSIPQAKLMNGDYSGLVSVAVFILGLILQIGIAIIIHRSLILGAEYVTHTTVLPKLRNLKFFVFSIAMGIIFIPLTFLLLLPVPHIPYLCVIAGIAYLTGRLALVFPDIAVDGDWSFGESWKVTKPHQLAMILAVGAMPAILGTINQQLYLYHQIQFISALITALLTVFTVAVLSVAYTKLKETA